MEACLLPKMSIFNLREGIREREIGEEEGGGGLFEEGDYLIFRSKGAVIRGGRFIEGRLVIEEIRYLILHIFTIIIWLCLSRTRNYQIHEFDWLKSSR